MVNFNNIISSRRKELKLTQKELAEILNVSDKTISKWEVGINFPDITMLAPLANALDVNVTQLLGAKDLNEPNNEKKDIEDICKIYNFETKNIYAYILILIGFIISILSSADDGIISSLSSFIIGLSIVFLSLVFIIINYKNFHKFYKEKFFIEKYDKILYKQLLYFFTIFYSSFMLFISISIRYQPDARIIFLIPIFMVLSLIYLGWVKAVYQINILIKINYLTVIFFLLNILYFIIILYTLNRTSYNLGLMYFFSVPTFIYIFHKKEYNSTKEIKDNFIKRYKIVKKTALVMLIVLTPVFIMGLVNKYTYDFNMFGSTCVITSNKYSKPSGDVKVPSSFLFKTVTELDDRAFANNPDIISITLPKKIKIIGEESFYYSKISEIEIPEMVEIIESRAFINSYLESIVIPRNVEFIGDEAFSKCWELNNVTIEEGNLKVIPHKMFNDCIFLETVNIPKTIMVISDDAFLDCNSLKEINIIGDNPNYISVDGVLYNKDMTILIKYPSDKDGEDFTLPSSVQEIAINAFSNIRNLTNIEVEEGNTYFYSKYGNLYNVNHDLVLKTL